MSISPTFRYERWSQGTRKIALATGNVVEIVKQEGNGIEVYLPPSPATHFTEDPFDGSLAAAGGVEGTFPMGEPTLASVVHSEGAVILDGLRLRADRVYAQSGGTPDPALFEIDVLVDNVSILTAPVPLPYPSTNLDIALPVAHPDRAIPALSQVSLVINEDWVGNLEGGEWGPGFENLVIGR